MCIDTRVKLPTVERFLFKCSLKNGCKLILTWTMLRTFFCFLFFVVALFEVLVQKSFPFGHILIRTSEDLMAEARLYYVFVSYIALLVSEAMLLVHVIYLCHGLIHRYSRIYELYLTCRFATWLVEVVGLFTLCVTHKSLIGWYLGMLLFVILEFYSFIVVYSYYVSLLDSAKQKYCKEYIDSCETCII